ncbi:MAG: hypothetical protein P1U56_10455 [Saprospiraceae bacterium]|nr:hypothetical protein [Saprospiraceae bacterium]
MKVEFEQKSKIKINDDLSLVLNQFKQRFGSVEAALYKFGEYVGFDEVVDKKIVRNYEAVPFEAELPLATENGGIHMGWLNLCPENPNFQKPFISWDPLGGNIDFFGCYAVDYIASCINQLHGDGYHDIDLSFLADLDIYPKESKTPIWVSENDVPVRSIPLLVESHQIYQTSFDGVGVLTDASFFESTQSPTVPVEDCSRNRTRAISLMYEGKFASSLILLKYNYFSQFFKYNSKESNLETLNYIKNCYLELNKEEIANVVQLEIEAWEKNN